MNRILLICLVAATVAFGTETNLTITVGGVTYSDVRFQRSTPASVTIFHSTGVATIPLEQLSPELQRRFDYDPQRAAQWQAAQQKAATEAAEAQRKAAAEAAEEQRKAAGTVEWTLTVERVLADGIIARGCRTSDLQTLATGNVRNPRVDAFTNHPTIYCPHPVAILLVDHPASGGLAEGNEITPTAYREGIAVASGRTLEKWVYYDPKAPRITRHLPSSSSRVITERIEEQPQTVEAASHFPQLRANGMFGFPQKDAKVLCDRPTLRFSVWNNDRYLFAQAVLWKDDDSSIGKDGDGNPLGDYSQLALDLDNDGTETADLDRVYYLNTRPSLPGLRYAISKGNGATTGLKGDSEGRGAIRYVETSDGKRARVDTFLISLPEISRRVGDKIGLCYFAYSPKPQFGINSVTYDNYSLRNRYSGYVLAPGGIIDVAEVPEGRNDMAVSSP